MKSRCRYFFKEIENFFQKATDFQKQTNTWNTFLNVLKKERRRGPLFGNDMAVEIFF